MILNNELLQGLRQYMIGKDSRLQPGMVGIGPCQEIGDCYQNIPSVTTNVEDLVPGFGGR